MRFVSWVDDFDEISHRGREWTEVKTIWRRHRRCVEQRRLSESFIRAFVCENYEWYLSPKKKRRVHYTPLSLSCAVGTSVIVFPSVFSASPCALLCSRITLSLPISEEPKVDAGPSVVLTAGRHSRRLAVRGDAEAVGSRQPPPGLPCRRRAVEAAVCG